VYSSLLAVLRGTHVVPVEVKAGSTGSLKSLHLFVALRGVPLAVRFNADIPSIVDVSVRTTTGQPVQYRLLSLPAYLAEKVHDWIALALEESS
jgi:uncharacterized protein